MFSVMAGRAEPVSSSVTASPDTKISGEEPIFQLGVLARSQAPEAAPVQVTPPEARVTGMVSVSAPEPTATV